MHEHALHGKRRSILLTPPLYPGADGSETRVTETCACGAYRAQHIRSAAYGFEVDPWEEWTLPHSVK